MAISGGSGNDILHGGAGNDVLFGNAGNDKLYGHGGRDRLDGGSGNDLLDGGAGNDQMSGGSGNDVYIVDSKGDTVVEHANHGIDTVRASIALTAAFANVENYTFTGSGPVSFTGNGLNNVIAGTGADDVLRGDAGNDVLIGGAGQDRLIGGSGNDTLVVSNLGFKQADGGSGTDTLSFTGAGSKIDLALYAGTSIKDIERIDLSQSGADDLTLSKLAVEKASSSTNQLIVDGKVGDVLHLDGAFALSGTKTVGGETYAFYKAGGDSVLVDQAITVNPPPPEPVSNVKLADLDGSNGFSLGTGESNSHFGFSVAGIGDVNGDGFADVVIGARYSGDDDQGASYVVFGKAAGMPAHLDLNTLDGANGFRLGGADFNYNIGTSVAGAGDFNGDGIADILISGPRAYLGGGTQEGRAYVIFGQTGGFDADIDLRTITPAQGFYINGEGKFTDLGGSVASAGDINGDGYDDLIIGAQGESNKGAYSYSGAAYVVFGHGGAGVDFNPADADGIHGFKLEGGAKFDLAGYSVASAGDVNGDGYADILMTAPNADQSYVIFGRKDGFAPVIDLTTLGGTDGFTLVHGGAHQVNGLGDINGDGYADFAIGDPFDAQRTGEVNVVFGHGGAFAPSLDVDALNGNDGFTILGAKDEPDSNGNAFGEKVGFSVASAGDFNGDGYTDLLIGAPHENLVNAAPGGAYLLYGSAAGFAPVIDFDADQPNGLDGFRIDGVSPGGSAGWSVASAGDVNGDGFDDLIVGAPYANGNTGEAYVIYGGNFRAEASQVGGSGSDTLTGGAGADILVGGRGNDTLNGSGGADAFNGGAGNDQIHVADKNFHSVEGGTGTDTLHFNYAGAINLGDIDGNAATADRGKIAGVEVLDFDNGQSNAVSLHLADVLDLDVQNSDVGGLATLDNVLKVAGNSGDSLTLFAADGWGAADTASIAGYAVYSTGAVKVAVETDIAVHTV